MTQAADAMQPVDKAVPVASSDTNVLSTAGGQALTSKDSHASYQAMKPADSTAGALPTVQIDRLGDQDYNPYAKMSQPQLNQLLKDAAAACAQDSPAALKEDPAHGGVFAKWPDEAKVLGLPESANQLQITDAFGKIIDAEQPTFQITEDARHRAQALAKTDPKLLTDLGSNDPKVAKEAAKHYLDTVFQDTSKHDLGLLRDSFHMTGGNVDIATELMGIPKGTEASIPVMNYMGNMLDHRAPRETRAQKEREENTPSIGFMLRTGQFGGPDNFKNP